MTTQSGYPSGDKCAISDCTRAATWGEVCFYHRQQNKEVMARQEGYETGFIEGKVYESRKQEAEILKHYTPNSEVKRLVKNAELQARLDELSHIQLEYGGKYEAMTYKDEYSMTVENRIIELKGEESCNH